jgi:hypothetical protein
LVTRACVLVVSAIALCACGTRPGLLVVVDTDFAVPEEIASLHVAVERVDGVRTVTEDFPLSGRDLSSSGERATLLPLSFAIRAPDPPGEIVLTVEGRDASGTVLVTRSVQTGFIAGTTRALPIFLARVCASVTCPPLESCIDGACRSSVIDPHDLPSVDQPNQELDASSPDGGTCEGLACEVIAQIASSPESLHTCARTTKVLLRSMVSAEGCVPQTQRVRADRDQRIAVHLERVARPARSPRPPARPAPASEHHSLMGWSD